MYHGIQFAQPAAGIKPGRDMSTLAEVFARQLIAEDIHHVFGFPGGATVELAEAARAAELDFVLGHSEWAAGYMAATYGELTQRPGVVLATLGPGATNLINATAHAYLDRAPLLVLTGSQSTESERNVHQGLNQGAIYQSITKWNTVASAVVFEHQIRKAVRIATTERPGPVHLDVPAEQPNRDVPIGKDARQARLEPCYGVPSSLEDLVGRLRRARRPIAIVGHSAVRARASEALRRFVEMWGIPVLTTPKAKGALPETHSLWAGVMDMAGARYLDTFVAQADLVLAIGLDGAELIHDWKHSTPTVHLDSVPNLDYVYESELDVVGDLGNCLDAVAGAVAPGAQRKWCETDLEAHRAEWRRRIIIQKSDGLAPSQVVLAAREVLPPDAMVTCDSGSHKMLVGALWQTYRPATFAVSNGLSTMGYSLPAAISAKILEPSRPVLAFTGDGGFAMVEAELGTAVDRQLPIIVVIFNDGCLDRILRKQLIQGYPAFGTTFGNPEFVKFSEAYGATGYSVRTVAEVQQALTAALSAHTPVVIDARINPDEYALQFSA